MRRIWEWLTKDKSRINLKKGGAAAVTTILAGVWVALTLVPNHHPPADNIAVADGIAVESGNKTMAATRSGWDAVREAWDAQLLLRNATEAANAAEPNTKAQNEARSAEAEAQVHWTEAVVRFGEAEFRAAEVEMEAKARNDEAWKRWAEAEVHLAEAAKTGPEAQRAEAEAAVRAAKAASDAARNEYQSAEAQWKLLAEVAVAAAKGEPLPREEDVMEGLSSGSDETRVEAHRRLVKARVRSLEAKARWVEEARKKWEAERGVVEKRSGDE